jgi:hypothetical protein
MLTSMVVFNEVKRAIDQLDPEGLLAAGAPADEYDSEAQAFASVVLDGEPITPAVVRAVWVERFYPECELVRYNLDVPLAEALRGISSERA